GGGAALDRIVRMEFGDPLRDAGRHSRGLRARHGQQNESGDSHGILSRYFASATSVSAQIRARAAFDSGESTSICMKASLPRCFREHDSDAMLIPSSAMIFVTSEIMPGRSR